MSVGHGMRAAIMCSITALVLPSCSGVPAPLPDQVKRIVLSVGGCASPCDGFQIGMFPDGHFTFMGRTPNEYRGRIDWSDMVHRLLATHFFSDRTDYTTTNDQRDIARRNFPTTASLYVGFAGTARQVDIDYGGNAVADIRDYERHITDTVQAAVGRLQQERANRLGDFSSIQSIELERGGGYGTFGCCGRFRITVSRSGAASVWYCGEYAARPRQGTCASAKGHVDFRQALAILRDTGYASFEPRYAVWGADMPTARLVVKYRNFSYVVDAPDETHWPLGLTKAVYRFQQLIADSSWKPPIERGR
jgi:hypothetical protein